MPARRIMLLVLLLSLVCGVPRAAQGQDAPPTLHGDALQRILTLTVDARDAKRFASVFRSARGAPTAEQLEAGYLRDAGPGVAAFTPGRIESATTLAAAVARDSARYAYAIATCLPLVDGLSVEMRSVYLAYAGLLPGYRVPEVHVVFGAGNSGGTATPSVQVVGLEVMCAPGTSPAQFRAAMRRIFAHETVHSFQNPSPSSAVYRADPLLFMALLEGAPDFLSMMVTSEVPGGERDAWAQSRERDVWRDFEADRARVLNGISGEWDLTTDAQTAMKRWFGNYGSAPSGWPAELGYWVGMQIARAYYERAADKPAAVAALIAMYDPAAILAASGYRGRE